MAKSMTKILNAPGVIDETVHKLAGMGSPHYGTHGETECGADYPNMGLTTVIANVVCMTCLRRLAGRLERERQNAIDSAREGAYVVRGGELRVHPNSTIGYVFMEGGKMCAIDDPAGVVNFEHGIIFEG
jgi:hypothetical protein